MSKIIKNLNEIKSRQEKAKKFIEFLVFKARDEPNLEKAISISEWIARFLVMNSCGIYRLDSLEEVISERLPEPPLQQPDLVGGEIHIASEIYHYGGHTRLIQNLLDASNCGADVLVSRGDAGQKSILNLHGGRFINLKASTRVGKACEIMRHALNYKIIYIHIHPEDVVSAAALHRLKPKLKNSKIIFVNHADHTFSVGLSSVDFIFEISSYGWNIRKKRNAEEISSFIGIPVASRQRSSVSLTRKGLILSGGDAYKFKPGVGESFQKNIKHILLSNKSFNVVVVGPKWHDYWWWSLRLLFPWRLNIKAKLPYESYIEYLDTCSIYLDSYPVIGGTAFTEALMRGRNVAGLAGPINGYGIADELKSKNILELSKFINKIDECHPDVIEKEGNSRARAIAFHSPGAVRQRILQTIETGVLHPSPFPTMFPNEEPWFDLLWGSKSKIVIPGFSNFLQVRAVFLVVVKPLYKNFGMFRIPFLQLLLKVIYGIIRGNK